MTGTAPGAATNPASTFTERLREVGRLVSFDRNDLLCHEMGRPDHVLLLATGFAVAAKRTTQGKQQNVALYFPNDIVGHEVFTLGLPKSEIIAITETTCHKISHTKLRDMIESDADYRTAFWHYIAFQGALGHEWLLNLGRRSAYERTAHLLCEIVHRSGAGRADAQSCSISLTQSQMANTLGLSMVHVNRTLKRLRQERLLTLEAGRLNILDWPRFRAAAGFNSGYLHQSVPTILNSPPSNQHRKDLS